MRRLALVLLCLVATVARAGWREDVAPPALVGEGRLCMLGFCLYDAQLWGRHDPLRFDAPFALVLTYRHSIARERLVNTGIQEIIRLAGRPIPPDTLQLWRQYMLRSFIDVKPGDSLCGVFLPGVGARFYANDRLMAEIDDPQFARAFFGIWLDANTRARDLRHQLLGSYAPS